MRLRLCDTSRNLMTGIKNLSVIIPVGPEEDAWKTLLADLCVMPADTEIILAAASERPKDLQTVLRATGFTRGVKWLKSPKGRAKQLNAGAKGAEHSTLWFLHADSRISSQAISSLKTSLKKNESAIHYFNLAFSDDGPALTRINSAGAWIRSHVLGLPFGDQGFCVPRSIFQKLGGFDEIAPYGEDHLFIWKARQKYVPIVCTGGWIGTCARKYSRDGWSTTTVRHAVLTAKQAIPGFFRLLKERVIP